MTAQDIAEALNCLNNDPDYRFVADNGSVYLENVELAEYRAMDPDPWPVSQQRTLLKNALRALDALREADDEARRYQMPGLVFWG